MRELAGLSEAQFSGLLSELGSFEIYVPIDEHRAEWAGGSEIIVGTYLHDTGPAVGFELDGDPLMLSPRKTPPATTIAVVPAEAFDDAGVAYESSVSSGSGTEARSNVASTSSGSWTGVWVTEVSIGGDYDGWGDPEYVFFVDDAEKDSGSRRIRCREEDNSVEPFRWNMNDGTYTKHSLIIEEGSIPINNNLAFSIEEDDDTRCERHHDSDLVKQAGDAIRAAQSAHKAYQERDFAQAGMNLLNAAITALDFANGDDELVGLASGDYQIDGTERRHKLVNENGNTTGYIWIQWKTDEADYPD